MLHYQLTSNGCKKTEHEKNLAIVVNVLSKYAMPDYFFKVWVGGL